jgi:PAS domain S-box-containing protein
MRDAHGEQPPAWNGSRRLPRAALELYRRIFDDAPVPMAISDPEGRFIDANASALRLFELRREEIVGRTDRELKLPQGDQVRLEGAAGERWTVTTFRLPAGSAAAPELADRRRFEEALRQSEARLEQAQALAQLGSWDWDLRTDAVTRSRELCRMFGLSEEEFGTSSSSSYDRVHPDDRERLRAAVEGAVRAGQPWDIEYRIIRPDGLRHVHALGEVVCDSRGQPLRAFGTAQDITERRMAQARLVLADRMASVGTLAAGVAHEINNPLTAVISNLEMIGADLHEMAAGPMDDRFTELVAMTREAQEGAERVRKSVRDLKIFARAGDDRRVPVELPRILELAINMAFTETRYRARVVRDFGDLPAVDADEGRLAQLFVDLIVNAARAIPEGNAQQNEIRLTTRTDGEGRAVVEVRDNGPGITPQDLGRIFDPFFTPATLEGRNGLGLSICHGIVTSLGGEITVESELGRGTVFRIALPATGSGRRTPDLPGLAAAGATALRGRLLVIDDDPAVAGVIVRMLSQHEVTAVHGGAQALERLAAGARYDLILCDVTMPEMTGMDVHAALSQRWPALAARVVFMTGGAFTPATRAFLEGIPNPQIEKPFRAESLRQLVQRLLES